MKNTALYIFLAILFIYLIATSLSKKVMEFTWNEDYDMLSNEPYSSLVLSESLARNPNVHELFISEYPIGDFDLDDLSIDQYFLFFVNQRLRFDTESLNGILDYVEEGNNVFFSAYSLDAFLLSELELKVSSKKQALKDTLFTASLLIAEKKKNFTLKSKSGEAVSNYFSSIPNSMEILGYDDDGKVNFIRKKIDRGYLYLHLMPKAFANLNLVDPKTIKYADAVFELIAAKSYYLDNYYKGDYQFQSESHSAFDYLFKHPQLSFAFYFAIILILLFLLFNTRRRQNIMKLHSKPANKSKEFAYTIAQLYYSRKDNKSIAKTEIAFLMNHFRESYHYQKIKLNERLAEEIAYQSNCSKKLIVNIFNKIIQINKMKVVESADLLALTELIKEYHNTRV